SLDVRRREAATRLTARNVVAIDALDRTDQRRILLPSEAELSVFGDAPLPKRDRVLRVTTRRHREVGKRRRKRRRKAKLKALDETRRQIEAGLLCHRHSVPQPAMREEMIILSFVPRAVGEQAARKVMRDARWTEHRVRRGIIVAQHARG